MQDKLLVLQNTSTNTKYIKSRARELGFFYCGIARAEKLDEDARRLEHWLSHGMHGSMKYMENYFDLRTDPTKLVPGAKSVITLLMNYHTGKTTAEKSPRIASYALGNDYHDVIRNKLKVLFSDLKQTAGEIQGRGFVDSAPVLERSWAQKSGLGWIGRNGNLIHPKAGSFFFIATIITDLKLEYDPPFAKDFCGTCSKCVDACPTDAILPDKVVDGSKCISYFTIELKEMMIPESMKGKFDNWMFGCDTCQDVCPWNRFATVTQERSFQPIPELLNLTTEQWEEMSEEQFKLIFRNSAISRAKYAGIKRNLSFIKQ